MIPWSIGKRDQSWPHSFFQCIRLLFDETTAVEVWQLAGGRNVNILANHMSLSPTFHRLYNRDRVPLHPVYRPNEPVAFSVRFAHSPPIGRHTTTANSGHFVALGQEHLLWRNSVGCGHHLLHKVMIKLEQLAVRLPFYQPRLRGSEGPRWTLAPGRSLSCSKLSGPLQQQCIEK